MDSRFARILIVLGSIILVLLMAIIVVLLVEDDGGGTAAPSATEATTAPTAATTTPTLPADTTEATTAPTLPPETTLTVPPMSPLDFAVEFGGLQSLRSGDNLLIGRGPEEAVASGWVNYPGPEFTSEDDGYVCGFGESTGIFATGDFGAMFMETGLVRIYIWSPDLITAEGLGLGSSRAEIETAMGSPDHEQVGHYVPTNTELRYQSGELGMLFVLDGDAVVEMSVGLWDELFLVEGCL